LTKDDINNAFDDMTCLKGASVIGMFENWTGGKEFRKAVQSYKGVQSYLKKYAFRSTTAADFLDSLSATSKQNVTTAFSTFLNQGRRASGLGRARLQAEQACTTHRIKRFLPLG
jgi:aminopeptidase N